ncbi:PIN domain-containing protein [Candidatus Palauibacter soopunensis]|uniref:type II toxin-antitoxin system VapC family toxin n=1 Tax=Candidatus Palauibacter soopunensis TaxID=3056739 RepID=UPI0023996749|nr:PIN domain-containing protein [Candidatus Palauibacter soopunensis]MDE2877741.1 PIN domain-containing protein [Candidatus Palauibacter soopunensis]
MAHDASEPQLAPLTEWLVDTGPIVAYLDPGDPAHQEVGEALDHFRGVLHTTGAVVTEAMHFITRSRRGPSALADFVAYGDVCVHDACQPPGITKAALLMDRYADTPMDFADATLVLLAQRLDVHDILTLDRRGFRTYRTDDGRPFQLILDQTEAAP